MIAVLVWCLAPAGRSAPAPLLRDVTPETAIKRVNVSGSHTAKQTILEENGSGVALFDYDGDGDLDLYWVNGGTLETLRGSAPPVRNALYRNDGGWHFVDVTAHAGVGHEGWGFGVAVGDVDGDGDPDLYVTNFGANVLYLNQGDGRFVDVTDAAGVGDLGWGHSAAFGDYDGDGDLDLYLANNLEFDIEALPNGGRPCAYRGLDVACGPIGFTPQPDRLFQNDGDGTFTDVSEAAGIHAAAPQFGLGVKMADLDDDGWLDIYVANDSGPNFFFRSLGRSQSTDPKRAIRFEEIAFLNGVATSVDGRYQAGMGVDSADTDGDGQTDLFVTNFAHDHNTLYRGVGEGLFRDDSHPSGLGGPSRLPMAWGTRFLDLDHDGDLDLYVANGHLYPEVEAGGVEKFPQPDDLFLNTGGRFVEASDRIERAGSRVSRGVATGDLDGDGDLDVVVSEMGAVPSLLRNEGAVGGYAILDLYGSDGNPKAVGAKIRFTTGTTVQRRDVTRSGSYLSSSDLAVHVGVGSAERLDRVEIQWPMGQKTVLHGLEASRRYVIRER